MNEDRLCGLTNAGPGVDTKSNVLCRRLVFEVSVGRQVDLVKGGEGGSIT